MSHTPGPWEVRELIPDGRIIRREGTYQIWTPEYDVAADVPAGGPFRKLEDAVLAAAAPDLLAALERLYWLVTEQANDDAFDNGVYAPDGRCEGDVIAVKIIEQARVALAGARGAEDRQ